MKLREILEVVDGSEYDICCVTMLDEDDDALMWLSFRIRDKHEIMRLGENISEAEVKAITGDYDEDTNEMQICIKVRR